MDHIILEQVFDVVLRLSMEIYLREFSANIEQDMHQSWQYSPYDTRASSTALFTVRHNQEILGMRAWYAVRHKSRI